MYHPISKKLAFQLTTLEIQGKSFKMQAIKSNVPDAACNYGTFQISKPEKACLPILVKIFSGWFTFETLYVLPIVKCKCIQEKYERFTKVFQVCLICKQQRKENKSRSSSLAGRRGAVFCTLCGTIVTRKRM